ncbi:retrovirus-related pol polyprotein from transposon TNT 1-94 [Tanacetum coccineum]
MVLSFGLRLKRTVLIKTKKYVELSASDKIQADYDMKATNIILQGLPADIYSLVNHHRVAKDLWERVQLLCKVNLFDKGMEEDLINNMNIYKMKMEQFQVNTKFLNSLPPEWSFDVPVFSPGDDPIACLNKAMAFLTAVASSSATSSGIQRKNYYGTTYKGNATSSRGNTTSGQARVVKCYNCQGEGHMARQCTQPKRPRNAAWYKEKAMLAEAQEARQILDEEKLAFLADQNSIHVNSDKFNPHNAATRLRN